MLVPLSWYLVLSAILFSLGVIAFVVKKDVVTIFISIELMLNGVNLAFIAFSRFWNQVAGNVFVFFVMVVAAAEAAVGLAIITAVFRNRNSLEIDEMNLINRPTPSPEAK